MKSSSEEINSDEAGGLFKPGKRIQTKDKTPQIVSVLATMGVWRTLLAAEVQSEVSSGAPHYR